MTTYQGRRCASIENEHLRVSVLQEGGHIAEILDKETGINPLWTPPWQSIEPSTFDAGKHAKIYGSGAEAKLLAGIMGHNLCLDIFGGPSAEEAAAGLKVHGEGSVAPYKISSRKDGLICRAKLPQAGIAFERSVELRDRAVLIRESVENLTACDKPIGWTQHVTLGPPFLKRGETQFCASATLSKVFETAFGAHDYLQPGVEFEWPYAPRIGGGTADLRVMNGDKSSSSFTTHLTDTARERAFFVAFSPTKRLAFGYIWKQADFPWLGIWEENHSRRQVPWKSKTLTRGMEFGVSPIPETRRQMIERGRLFGVPTYRWLPAKGRLEAEYRALALRSEAIPEDLA